MNKLHNFNLEERTLQFAKDIRTFLLNYSDISFIQEDLNQLLKSSGSVGANYLEANDSLGKKDFLMRLRIARKEAKESIYFLRLLISSNSKIAEDKEATRLLGEGLELKRILSAIIIKSNK